MSLKQEIETWVKALAAYDNNEFSESLKVFDNIADTSKILFNCGVIQATLGEHDKAVECYQRAIALDQYLAVAYFQQGVSNFLVGDFEEALANFNDTLLYLRGNTYIDYEQLGLKFRLYSCEVLFNRGLCYIYLQQMEPGLADLGYAAKEKVTPDHDVIDDAIREQAEGYTVFSIPVGVVYRPNMAKVKNLKTKDYLGKARLVAASDRNNAFTGFQGSELKKAAGGAAVKDDRPSENISYAATNLVNKNIVSRTRQQSEPPLQRNMFPPTPPPETDGKGFGNNAASMSTRAASVRNRGGPIPMPQRGDTDPMPSLERSMTGLSMASGNTNARIGTTRTASEPRGPPSRQYSRDNGRFGGGRDRDQPRPLFREQTGSSRRQNDFVSPVEEDEFADEVYDMYTSPRSSGSRRAGGKASKRDRYGGDDMSDYASEAYDDDSPDDVDFEMVGGRSSNRDRSRRPSNSRASSRRPPEIRKIRVKVHSEGPGSDDTRYIMIGSAVEFGDFEGRIREKFGIRSGLRIRTRDEEGDMITMGDQDDLEMLVSQARSVARKEKAEMGKMEIWISQLK